MSQIPGFCPVCGDPLKTEKGSVSYIPEYDVGFYYVVSCKECGWHGKEWYHMKFYALLNDDGTVPRK